MNSPLQFLTARLDHYHALLENIGTGQRVAAQIVRATAVDLREATKKAGWRFKWRDEARQIGREVYKLALLGAPATTQGLISLEDRGDHTYMSLIESAPFNQGRLKQYNGVAGSLVAFACKLAFERGQEGNLAFTSKTVLIEHYEHTLGAFHYQNHQMILETGAAVRLIQRHLKPFSS